MGPWCLWCGSGVSFLLPNLGSQHRPAGGSPARRNFAVAAEATPGSDELLQRTHPGAHAPGRLVIRRFPKHRATLAALRATEIWTAILRAARSLKPSARTISSISALQQY